MLTTLQWFFIVLVPIGALSLIAIVAPAERFWKVSALGLTAVFLPIGYLAAADLLSRPKPFEQELLRGRLDGAVVLSSLIREGEDIHVWLKVEGVDEPRAYRLPWNEGVAVQLHKAEQEAERQGAETTLELPEGELADGDLPMFDVAAPPVLPPKEVER